MSTSTTPAGDTPALTRQLASWAVGTTAADLPEEVRSHVQRLLVDYLSAAVIGTTTETATLVRNYYSSLTSTQTATVIGTELALAPAAAAAVNATTAHALDADDGYTPGACHPGAPIISAALAAAEARGVDADALIRSIALGYEVALRMAGASHPAQRKRGFHNTALVGVFGATVAVGSLLDLDADGMANALGLAASHAGGLLTFLDQGAEVKRYHAGKAAHDGLVCAELAAAGLTGPTTALESKNGYFHAFTGDTFDLDHLIGELGQTWRTLRTYAKPYPCCRHLHGAIDAALVLVQRHSLQPEAIREVVVDTFDIAATHDSSEIETFLDAQMSVPYSVAAALVAGEVGLSQFDETARADSRINDLMKRITVRADAELTAAYPANRPARVTITTDTDTVSELVMQPLGEPDNPLPDADLDAKFRRLATPVIGAEAAEKIIDAARNLDDTARLFRALSTA